MRIHLQELLETRLRLTQAWGGRLAAIKASTIQRPIFITGMPRSGSTFLHELLAEDPENRAPRVWEVMFPIPIGTRAATKADPRLRKAEFSLWCFRQILELGCFISLYANPPSFSSMRYSVVALLFLLALPLSCLAAVNFSGVWTLDLKASDSPDKSFQN
jgi:hypothetical protein